MHYANNLSKQSVFPVYFMHNWVVLFACNDISITNPKKIYATFS